MRQFIRCVAAGLCAILLGTSVHAADKAKKPSEEATCGDHGTSVHFENSPSEAARRALKEQKLVFVLHISGNFEDSGLT